MLNNKKTKDLLRKSYKIVLGEDGKRTVDQQRVFDDIVTGNIYRTSVEEKAVAHTARDLAVHIHRHLNREEK